METLKVGIMSAEDFKKRTMDIARGNYKPKKDEPRVWFQSVEAFSQVLSSKAVGLWRNGRRAGE